MVAAVKVAAKVVGMAEVVTEAATEGVATAGGEGRWGRWRW